LDVRTDVYSLGVILYQLVTRSFPYPVSGNMNEVVRNIMHASPARPTTITSGLDRDVEVILLKCLEKDAQRRYQSAGELARDIQRYLKQEPIEARPASSYYQIRQFARRNKGAFSAIAATFAILLAGVIVSTSLYLRAERARVFAEDQRNRAVEAETKAGRRFKDVHHLARTFIFDFHDKIMDLEGATPAREFLVRTALEYLDNLTKEAGEDRDLLRDLATAYRKIGDVQGYPDNPNLGDLDGAMVSYQKGLNILEALPSVAQSAEERRALMLAYQRIGEWHTFSARPLEGLEPLRKALAIAESLAAADPRNRQGQGELAEVHVWLAQCHAFGRQSEEAAKEKQLAVQILHPLVEDDPRDMPTLRVLFKAYYRGPFGKASEALATGRKMLQVAEKMLELEPGNSRIRYHAFIARLAVALALRSMGYNTEALDIYYELLRYNQLRVGTDPLNEEAQNDLATNYSGIAATLWRMGRYAEAEQVQRTRLGIYEAILAGHPDNTIASIALPPVYAAIAENLAGMGRHAEALTSAGKALELLGPVLEANPQRVSPRQTLWAAHRVIGDSLNAIGQVAEAWESHNNALAVAAGLSASEPDNPELQRPHAISLHCLGDLQLQSGQYVEALEKYRQAMAINESCVALDPDVAEARRELSLSYEKMGDATAALGQDETKGLHERLQQAREAQSWYQRASDMLMDMDERGILPGRDAGRPDDMATKVSRCESDIAELESQLPDQRPQP
jgi:tetratricopeptide (TPR) repeat protein